MKKVTIFLIVATVVITLNGTFFEYCVSRPCPLWITTALSVIVTLIDVWVIWQGTALLGQALNLNEKSNNSKTKKQTKK